MAFPVGCCLGRRGGFACRATVSPLHDHRIVLTAPLCYTVAMPICCGCHRYCRTAPPHRSVTAPLLPLRYCRDAAPLRYFRACCRHRAAPLRPRGSAAAVLLPPTALLLLRSSTLPRCSAPRRSASLCDMLPALHRAASKRGKSIIPRSQRVPQQPIENTSFERLMMTVLADNQTTGVSAVHAEPGIGKSTATTLALRNGMPNSSVGVLLQGDFQKNLRDFSRAADAADAVQVAAVLFDLIQARGIRLQILFDNTFDQGVQGQKNLLLGLTRSAFDCGHHLLVVTQSEKAAQEVANLNGERSRAWAQNDARSYRWRRTEARKYLENNPLLSNEQTIDAVLNSTAVPDEIGGWRPVSMDEYLRTGRRPQAPQAGQGSQFKFRMAHMVVLRAK